MSLRMMAMDAAKASLSALYPEREVLIGMQDPAVLGDERLTAGVYCLVSEKTAGWADFVGREAQYGTLNFALVGYLKLPNGATTEDVERAEAVLEDELLAWCGMVKPAPIDAVYPSEMNYSRGFDCPYCWVVMAAQALYV